MEMSCFNKNLPRYYDGYDLNRLWEKEQRKEPLMENELSTINRVVDNIYGKMEHEQAKKWVKAQILEIQNEGLHLNAKAIGPVFSLDGKSRTDIIQEIYKREQEEFDMIYEELKESREI